MYVVFAISSGVKIVCLLIWSKTVFVVLRELRPSVSHCGRFPHYIYKSAVLFSSSFNCIQSENVLYTLF
jgi:hypothetical protein